MLKEATDILKRVGQDMLSETILSVLGTDIPGEFRQQAHVLSKANRDIRLQNLEHASLALPRIWVIPGEADDGADTSFQENVRFDLDLVFPDSSPQLMAEDGMHLLRGDIGNTVFEFRQSFSQLGVQVPVTCQHLTEFLQARNLGDEAQQARFCGRLTRKVDLLNELRRQPRGG